jgi:hypothetical protein
VRRGVGKKPGGHIFMVVFWGGEKQHRGRADDQKVGGRRTRKKIDEG